MKKREEILNPINWKTSLKKLENFAVKDYTPFIYPPQASKALCLFDVHCPHQNNKALELVISKGIDEGCNSVILGGDIIDCGSISKYLTNPLDKNLNKELDVTRRFLHLIKEAFPWQPTYMLEGNHEARMPNYIYQNAEQLAGLPELTLDSLLQLKSLNIQYSSGKKLTYFGNLMICHGHEFAITGQNPATKLLNQTLISSMCGHVHVTDECTKTTADSKTITCWTVGMLGHTQVSYRPYGNNNLGFAIVELLNGQGDYHVDNYRIVNSKNKLKIV